MRGSQYTEDYLLENQRRGGAGQGITPGTYLSSVLRGRAKSFKFQYQNALERDLESRPDVIRDRSKTGAIAYYRIELEPDTVTWRDDPDVEALCIENERDISCDLRGDA